MRNRERVKSISPTQKSNEPSRVRDNPGSDFGYDEAIALLIARHNMTFLEASQTTLEEFEIYNMAYLIQQEDLRYHSAIQAWFNQTGQATKGKGKSAKSAYRTLDDFYNHKKEFDKIFKKDEVKPNNKRLSLADRNRRLNQSLKERG